MSLPWSAQQVEWLQAMGLDVLRTVPSTPAEAVRTDGTGVPSPANAEVSAVPAWLARVAPGVDLAPLLQRLGTPRDPASRRAFWRTLRALRKAARQ